jgi:hypothetical protein
MIGLSLTTELKTASSFKSVYRPGVICQKRTAKSGPLFYSSVVLNFLSSWETNLEKSLAAKRNLEKEES